MQKLLSQIQTLYPDLSQSQKIVADYVLVNYKRIPFYTVTALAEELGVSDTTIIKFCMRLGLSGYGAFKRQLAGYLEQEVTTFDRMKQSAASPSDDRLLEKLLAAEQMNLQQTFRDPNLLEKLSALWQFLNKAKRCYVAGFRASAMAAEYLALNLVQQGHDARPLTQDAGGYADALAAMEDSDLLIAFTFNRYARQMNRLIEMDLRRKVPCILITDEPGSPCCGAAQLVFRCATRTLHYNSSMTGCVGLINAIIAYTARQDPKRLHARLSRLEQVFQEDQLFYY